MHTNALHTPELTLVRPALSYRESYLAGLREMTNETDRCAWRYLAPDDPDEFPEYDFAGYVQSLWLRETAPPPGFVCDTIYWGIVGGELVGRIAIRHELNEFLATLGGHIGYVVRPSRRRQGIATEMLRQALATPCARAIGKLLITCDEDNIASEKTIRNNGGVFENMLSNGRGKPRKKRFWIDLQFAGFNASQMASPSPL